MENSLDRKPRRFEVVQGVESIWCEKIDGVEIVRQRKFKYLRDNEKYVDLLDTREEWVE